MFNVFAVLKFIFKAFFYCGTFEVLTKLMSKFQDSLLVETFLLPFYRHLGKLVLSWKLISQVLSRDVVR